MEVIGVTVALLVVAGVSTVVVLVCETLMEQRRRRWTGWAQAVVALFVAVDVLGFRVASVPWLLGLTTVVMTAPAAWRLTQYRRARALPHA